MKRKISLFMSPLMAVALLASCGGGNTPTPPEPEAKDIVTDSWETFCYYANKGEEAFKKAYKIEDINSLIGRWNSKTHNVDTLEREVKLSNGLTTSVRLIGINHDDLATPNGKALFTFEFVDCLAKYVPYGFDPINVKWEDSYLRERSSAVVDLLPKELASSIKVVEKKTYNYKEDSTDPMEGGEMVTTKETMFPLSYIEVAGEEDLEDLSKPAEGETYALYKNMYIGGQYQYDYEAMRVKYDINDSEECDYFLRSPYLIRDSYLEHKVLGCYKVQSISGGESSGTRAVYGAEQWYFLGFGFAPAFCI